MSRIEALAPLGDVADIRQGRYLAPDEMAPVRDARNWVPVHGANGIIGWTTEPMYKQSVALVTCRGSNSGMVLWAEGPLWVSNNAMAILPNNKNYRFAYYALLNNPPYDVVSGSAQPQITRTALAPRRINWPNDELQESIVAALDTLDNKIELNRRTNETLEAMAQVVFRDWFVDFGPVRRKLAGERDPVAIMGGLITDLRRATSIAGVFPGEFGEDNFPIGWQGGDLSHYADINPEVWSARAAPMSVRYVDLSNTKWGTIESVATYSWKDAPSRARRVARPGDTLVGTVRPGNGSYSFVSTEGLTASTGFAHLRPKSNNKGSLIYFSATARENIDRLSHLADGAAYPAVNPAVVLATEIPIVSEDVVSAFDACVGSLHKLAEHHKGENNTLSEIRDFLLPRLMSGTVLAGELAETPS